MSLEEYQTKRNFEQTTEPEGAAGQSGDELIYVIQKHAASRLHYDLRLEMDSVLKSWAVPKGPSLDPEQKRLAIQVEDHPLSYADFEGVIPEGQYGAGEVIVWDRGIWRPEGPPLKGLSAGKLSFGLKGEKLKGGWTLVQMKGGDSRDGKNWLLIKQEDDQAQRAQQAPLTRTRPESVLSGRTLEDIRAGRSPENAPGNPAWAERAGGLPGSRPAEFPGFIEPQLARLVDDVPVGDGWLHEVKFDGYRLMASLRDGRVELHTRNRNDWTHKFTGIRDAIERLPLDDAVIDGEVVVLDGQGRSDFQALQQAEKHESRVYYYAFDLLYIDGYDLRRTSLVERKIWLAEMIETVDMPRLRYSKHTEGRGGAVFENACAIGLEGILSKRKDSVYESGRTDTWRKVKCYLRQEFVVAGYTEPKGGRQGFGALLLGYYRSGEGLIYAGRVGTGFDDQELSRLSGRLRSLELEETAFDDPPRGAQLEGVHWISPELVTEVRFIGWTDDGLVRQASFLGLREDKSPEQIRREEPARNKSLQTNVREVRETMNNEMELAAGSSSEFAGIQLTSPDRVLFPEQGVTKRELAAYYDLVAEHILPHVSDRPLALLRCPRGHEQECFFQKNYTDSIVGPIDRVELTEESGERATYMSVDDLPGLIQLAQLGVLELHPWGSRVDRLDRPDRLIFDLDPGPGVEWKRVIRAARLVRERLKGHGLVCFLKTSGGKGLHVVAPLERRADWERVKSFARAIAKGMARSEPAEFVATAAKAKRKGKIFVDYLRNSSGATNVAPYSTRARQGAPISTPVGWDELDELDSARQFNITNIADRLGTSAGVPWKGFFDVRQSITKQIMAAVEG